MTSVTVVRRIAASPERVFDAIVTADGIRQWWGPDAGPVLDVAFDARVGGRFRVRFRIEDGSEHEGAGTLLELVRPSRLAMTWRWSGDEDNGAESRLAFDLAPDGDGTRLVLTHSMLSDDESARGHEDGWNGALDKLVALFDR